ncbi:hypothetical protein [Actinokineospora sp. NBRC 105648]|uniref:hypothetical protein n=1 Tax=Actinokineospora sp. NBRC 105648 TaxID=3032206 RepID=UPI0024A2FABE|nr:hypothetical protein [Actinokineospora sp. NBRC 105648]GLZ38540.1 hypothetical protein Acsp05_21640 [Actinokineospora sp. NBRC 105648]
MARSLRTIYEHVLHTITGRATQLAVRGERTRARPWLLVSSAMSWLDFLQATARARSAVIVQYVSLGVALLGIPSGFLIDPKAFILTCAGLLLSIAGLVIEYLRAAREGVEMWLVAVPPLTAVEVAGTPEVIEVGDDLVYHPAAAGVALSRSSLGRPQARLAVSWTPGRRRLAVKIEQHRTSILLHKYRSTRMRPFNGANVTQLSSIEDSVRDPRTPVRFGPSRYFDLLVSNYLANEVLQDSSRREVLSVRALMLGERGRLVRFEDSRLADPVGVSTLAIDQNKRVVLIAHSETALSSAGRIAPSGSGSLEPRDLPRRLVRGKEETGSLCDAITTGMTRELLEESNLEQSDIRWSAVTGYFRWITRGGKPEYVGVTVLNRRTDELTDRRRLTEHKWVKAIYRDVEIDLGRLRGDPTRPQDCLGDSDLAKIMSVPLAMALTCLGQRLQDADFAAEFARQFD